MSIWTAIRYCRGRRAAIGALLGGVALATTAEAQGKPKRPNEAERELRALSALVEAQHVEIAKLRQALGLNPDDTRNTRQPAPAPLPRSQKP